MAVSGVGNYYHAYEGVSTIQKKEADASRQKRVEEAGTGSGMKIEAKKENGNEAYLKSLQGQVPYVKLEVGSALNMQRDKRAGVITVNPKLLEKMQNDPQAAEQYTQKLKDIERAERLGNAYYNSLGGCVERTSHWYVDEEGNHYHFAYTRRDDRLNKKIREETQKNMEEHIEKTRKKAREKAEKLEEKLEEKLAEKAEEAEKEEEIQAKGVQPESIPADGSENGEQISVLVNEVLPEEGAGIRVAGEMAGLLDIQI